MENVKDIEDIKDKADPLNIIPNIDLNASNVMYILAIIASIALIWYASIIHFMSYRSEYYSEIATVIEVDCNRFPVNNHRSEYHCVVGIEYPTSPGSNDITHNSLTFVDSERFYEGDRIQILVSKQNPLDIQIVVMSDKFLSIIYCVTGILLFIIATGARFMRFQ